MAGHDAGQGSFLVESEGTLNAATSVRIRQMRPRDILTATRYHTTWFTIFHCGFSNVIAMPVDFLTPAAVNLRFLVVILPLVRVS